MACHVTLRLGVIHAMEGRYHASIAWPIGKSSECFQGPLGVNPTACLEDARPLPPGAGMVPLSARACWQVVPFCLGLRAARQAHREDRALARLARHRHVAAHHARELAGDGEAEPGAAEALSGRGIGLTELL